MTQQDTNANPFGEIIHGYSRSEMLADGYMVDVTEQAKKCGFKIPVGITRNVWDDCCEWDELDEENGKGSGQSVIGRLNDVLTMAMMAAQRNTDADRLEFDMLRVKRGTAGPAKKVHLIMTCGPSDDMSPCITIMAPEDD